MDVRISEVGGVDKVEEGRWNMVAMRVGVVASIVNVVVRIRSFL